MSDDWQAGDLALCVMDKPCPIFGPVNLRAGQTYIVRAVKSGRCRRTGRLGTALKLFGQTDPHWHSIVRFQKAPNHEADAEDAETIRLLNRVPERAGT